VTGPDPTVRVIQADGRAKAYRPLPEAARAAALRSGLEAYVNGDFFLAHELLEPAWMGTADPGERAFVQGLIKLAAADVHGVRGNPRGVARNLEGALERLRQAAEADVALPAGFRLDALIADVETRLDCARSGVATTPTVLPWSR
jgi:predicted metal-dependent hydrolase